ncbi:MAG: hypothetical protein HZB87_03300 [Desulfatitalea sp.]|nr:hypothetical protein [Desulfatitalea sp.]
MGGNSAATIPRRPTARLYSSVLRARGMGRPFVRGLGFQESPARQKAPRPPGNRFIEGHE